MASLAGSPSAARPRNVGSTPPHAQASPSRARKRQRTRDASGAGQARNGSGSDEGSGSGSGSSSGGGEGGAGQPATHAAGANHVTNPGTGAAEEEEESAPLVIQCVHCKTVLGDTTFFVSSSAELKSISLRGAGRGCYDHVVQTSHVFGYPLQLRRM